MSITTFTTVICDACDDPVFEGEELDPDDVRDRVHEAFGSCDIEVNATPHEHLCSTCSDSAEGCSWCENGDLSWREDMTHCGNTILIDWHDCLQIFHRQLSTDDPDNFSDNECLECGYTFPERPREAIRKALITL